MYIKTLWLPLLAVLFALPLVAQNDFYESYTFTEADTLRGSLRPERTCYDVTYYELDLRILPARRYLEGAVTIHFDALEDFETLQIDLYRNMTIEKIVYRGRELTYRRKHDAVFVDFPATGKGTSGSFRINYHGQPTTADNPPWDGGFVWERDRKGKPWVGVACEGDGASLWWPNKDHLSDEPDSMAIRVAAPKGLMCVANGQLRQTVRQGELVRYDWAVTYPINNYNVTVNIARYQHFEDHYVSASGDSLPLDYYVLPYNLEKAKQHFRQVPRVLEAFEHYFGPYPFWEDGFAMVETPYLGMEHQGAIAYGNQYMRGYLGGMIPADMDWDYIIVHETGHEFFGNSISCNDLAEMWIHESFTTYMESLFVEYTMGYADAMRYLRSQRPFIRNREPILGPLGVNWEDWNGSDHYFKGAWVLNTLRHSLGNHERWFALLKGFYRKHAISNVTTKDFVDYVNAQSGTDYTAFFNQYLRYPDIPTFEYELDAQADGLRLRYRWKAEVDDFAMPLNIEGGSRSQRLHPTTDWQETLLKGWSEREFSLPADRMLIRVERR